MKEFDAIVVGGGHAGIEASVALCKMNKKTLLLSLSLNAIGYMACNPNIGGTAKGHLVKEIDALGGYMGRIADKATIQTRMLNLGNGPAVHSLRNQVDKDYYHRLMKEGLETLPNLTILESEASEILMEDNTVVAIKTTLGDTYFAKAVVLCTGVYLNSKVIIGDYQELCGPSGYKRASKLTDNLVQLGIDIRRFKTGTPPRILASSVDFSKMEAQSGDVGIPKFSYYTDYQVRNDYLCYLTYTNLNTHKIILDNLDKAPLYNGSIHGIGPRYCPSIEDKIVRFADKDRHQIFIEPEGSETKELYVQGLSTSMPFYIQEQMLHSISGLESAKITRYGYAIEYDCINPLDLNPSLAIKKFNGLYSGGQINGSSGYEEAGAQGLMAGINAALYIDQKPPFVLKRDEAYIGVLIDDLVTRGTNEPYRMMTSRAEFRVQLRQDNADIRLTEFGIKLGLIEKEREEIFYKKLAIIDAIRSDLKKNYSKFDVETVFVEKEESLPKAGISAYEILKRNNIVAQDLQKIDEYYLKYPLEILGYVAIEEKYRGYLEKQNAAIKESKKMEEKQIPTDMDYSKIIGLRIEACQKLKKVMPLTLAQASRISGVSPADITVLLMYLKKL